MKIVADENIPLLDQFFGHLGEVKAYPGRSLNAELVADADVLLVRSVTPVNPSLLQGSRVKFVGTTTIGLDHIDTDYLSSKGIGFCSAPGCNAGAVVEYVLSVLSVLAEQQGFQFGQKTVGIIGRGQIGSRLVSTLHRMGFKVKANDPPKALAGETGLSGLDEVLACDIISMHVPLVEGGPYPTRELLNAESIARLRQEQIIINTSRGDVVDEDALKLRLQQKGHPTVILDVFKNEPAIDSDLVRLCHFATPHIAGYSLDGKIKGTEMVYRSLCQHTGLPVRLNVSEFMPEPPLKMMSFSADADWALHTAIRACYDVRHDDSNLRRTLGQGQDENAAARAAGFDRLRKNYRVRRGFNHSSIRLANGQNRLQASLAAAGFTVQEG